MKEIALTVRREFDHARQESWTGASWSTKPPGTQLWRFAVVVQIMAFILAGVQIIGALRWMSNEVRLNGVQATGTILSQSSGLEVEYELGGRRHRRESCLVCGPIEPQSRQDFGS